MCTFTSIHMNISALFRKRPTNLEVPPGQIIWWMVWVLAESMGATVLYTYTGRMYGVLNASRRSWVRQAAKCWGFQVSSKCTQRSGRIKRKECLAFRWYRCNSDGC